MESKASIRLLLVTLENFRYNICGKCDILSLRFVNLTSHDKTDSCISHVVGDPLNFYFFSSKFEKARQDGYYKRYFITSLLFLKVI